MNNTLSKPDVWHAFVLPVLAALIIAALLMVERLQVDWSVDCSALASGCDTEAFRAFFGWLPIPLTYGVFHIWGARRLTGNAKPLPVSLRLFSLPVFLGIHLLPVPGLLLFYIGAAGGFAISLTVIGLVVSPFVGVLTAGFFAGAVLGLFAGPSFTAIDWRRWRTLLLYYGLGGALSSAALVLGLVVFDAPLGNTFGINLTWLTLLGTLATVIVVGAITNYFVLMGWSKAGLLPAIPALLPAGLKQPTLLAVPLVMIASFMVANNATIFRRDGAPFPPLAAMLRGDRPALSTELKLAGLTYVGPRDQLFRRGILKRDRMEFHVENKGTPDEVSVGTTVYDDFEQWELIDAGSTELITVTADASVLQTTLECEPGLNSGEEFCGDETYPRRDELQKTFAIAYPEEAFLRSIHASDAALAIRFKNGVERVENRRKWARLYCRLNLVNVTPAKFSAIQIIPCDADWVATSEQLRTRLESEFVVKAGAEKPAQP